MPDITVKSKRLRLGQQHFMNHGYTGGCPGCIHLRRSGAGPSKIHIQECRSRMEGELTKTSEGRARKEKERARVEEEFTQQLVAEDERQQMEKELAEKTEQEGGTAKGDGPLAQSKAKAADRRSSGQKRTTA